MARGKRNTIVQRAAEGKKSFNQGRKMTINGDKNIMQKRPNFRKDQRPDDLLAEQMAASLAGQQALREAEEKERKGKTEIVWAGETIWVNAASAKILAEAASQWISENSTETRGAEIGIRIAGTTVYVPRIIAEQIASLSLQTAMNSTELIGLKENLANVAKEAEAQVDDIDEARIIDLMQERVKDGASVDSAETYAVTRTAEERKYRRLQPLEAVRDHAQARLLPHIIANAREKQDGSHAVYDVSLEELEAKAQLEIANKIYADTLAKLR